MESQNRQKLVLAYGDIITSPGCSFTYQIIGPVCRLYDREELPYPSCSLSWRGKQPSWNRVGKRFIPDIASKRYPAYSVRFVGCSPDFANKVISVGWKRLDTNTQEWWITPSCKMKHYEDELWN